jgi:hypothetical protein
MNFHQPPKPDQEALLIHLIGQLKDFEEKLETLHLEALRGRREGWLLTLMGAVFHWIGTLSSYISTAFIAGYIAIEHTWYFERVGKWISTVLSWRL